MRYILAYGLVIVLAPFCLTLGKLLVTFVVAGCLAWTPERLRGVVAGTIAGLGGVAAAVAFGYFMFRLILGSGAFELIPLLASTIPLIIPILKDLTKARLLSDDLTKLRHLPAVQEDFVAIAVGVKFTVVGYILGLVLTFIWFFFAHESPAIAVLVQP